MGEEKEKPKEKEKDPKKEEKEKDKKKEEKDPKDKKEGADPVKEKPREKDPKEAKGKSSPPKSPQDEKKEKKRDEEKGSRSRKKLQKGMIVKTVKNAHKIEKILGSGEFGDVYRVSVVDKPGELYAMKTELDDAHKKKEFNRLKVETLVLEDLNLGKRNTGCFVKLIDKGTTPKFQFIVMELVSHSLRFIQEEICKGPISEISALYLARETLHAIATLHELGYIHRDIKPHNFAVGMAPNERRVYILDFGISRKCLDDKGQFMVPRAKVQFLGTLKYCSRACHLEKEQSMKDDIECWAYMCLEFRSELPWNKKKNRDEILKLKTELFLQAAKDDVNGPWPGCFLFFIEVLKMIDKMTFTDDLAKTAIRQYVEGMMKSTMKEAKTDEKSPLDWEGKTIPDSRPRKKTVVNRVQNDEDSSERKKREEKAKKREENLARAKKIEEELLKVMKDIEEGDQPQETKEMARRLFRREQQRKSGQKRRRSGDRKRRRREDSDEDYSDEDDYSDEEDDSYEDDRPRRRSKGNKRERYRDEDPRPRKKEGRKRTSRDDPKPRRLSKRTKRSGGKPRSPRGRRTRKDGEEKLMKMADSPLKGDDRRGKKRAEKGPESDLDAERKDSGKRSEGKISGGKKSGGKGGGTPLEGSKDKLSGGPSPSPTPNGSDKDNQQ